MKAATERASLAGVIAALAAAPGRGPSVARVAGQAVEFICKYYKVGWFCTLGCIFALRSLLRGCKFSVHLWMRLEASPFHRPFHRSFPFSFTQSFHHSFHCLPINLTLQEELSEDVKVALAAALGAWLPRCAGMPEPALARLAGEAAAGAAVVRRLQGGACWRTCNSLAALNCSLSRQ